MYSLLEAYLSQVEAQLNSLPPKRRMEELREMQAHLSHAMVIHQAQGQSEEAAVQTAIEQFGLPQTVGQETVAAYRRGQLQERKRFLQATIAVIILLNALPPLIGLFMCNLIVPFVDWMRGSYHWPEFAVIVLIFLLQDLPAWLLIGAITGRFFPKQARATTSWVVAAWIAVRIAQSLDFWWVFIAPVSWRHIYFIKQSDYRSTEEIIGWIFYDVLLALMAIVGTRIGIQWRDRKEKENVGTSPTPTF